MFCAGIEHLEQRGRRVTPPVTADLVDLVEHDHGVLGARFLQGAHDAAREGSDVGAPVSADVRLVVDAAEGDARELASERPRDRLAERRLADAGRSDQRDDRAGATAEYGDAALAAELANREELDDPLLHVLETGVILIEDAPCLGEVEVVLGSHVPGDLEHPVEIGPDPAVLRALLARPLEAVQLALDLLAHVLGHARVLEARPVAGDNIVATLAELLLDRLELLAQQEVALGLLHPLVDLGPHLLAHRCVGEDVLGPSDQASEALLDVERLQHLELLLDAEVRRVAGEVGQVAGVTNRAHRLDGAARATQLQEVLDERAVFARQLASGVGGVAVRKRFDLYPERAADVRLSATETRTVQSLEDRHLGTGWQLPGLDDLRNGADPGEPAADAGDEQDQVVAALRGGHRGTLGVALDRNGGGHPRHDDHVVELQDRKEFGGQFSHFQSRYAVRPCASGACLSESLYPRSGFLNRAPGRPGGHA